MQEGNPTKPELMSPAGYWPQLQAAVAAGADAVYFGLQHFSARAKVGFKLSELDDVIRYLHRHAVRGFVTFNTLVFDHEIQQAAEAIAGIAAAGCDAIIVQDIGMVQLAKQIAPELDVHGSTQMSVTSAQGAELAASLGCSRVVLGRELSLNDIRKISDATSVELEVFVHGALCVSYSGQCFSSEAWGGRSANRGQCAQACRLSYDLIVDGEHRDLGEFRYLLSPGDLYALEQIPDLVATGVACLKIEGRYKGPEYVALTTSAYRKAIDACFGPTKSSRQKQPEAAEVTRDDLEQIYSRGLGSHFVAGINHQNVVVGRAPRHRGLQVGRVDRVENSAVVVTLDADVVPGDGLVFDSASWRSPDEPEEGGNVFEVEPLDSGRCRLTFGNHSIDFERIRCGDLVYRSNNPRLNKRAERIGEELSRTSGLSFDVIAEPGQPLRITATSEQGEIVEYVGDQNLESAISNALNESTLKQQLSRLGGTPFHFDAANLTNAVSVFCPISQLNHARRSIVERIIANRESVKSVSIFPIHPQDRSRAAVTNQPSPPELHLLVRNAEQLEAAIELEPASITLDYLELYGLRPSVERIKEHGIVARVASPRILKPSEQNVVRFLLSLQCQILIRSGGLLQDLVANDSNRQGSLPELHGDFSLNAANIRSFQTYFNMGLSRITPTYDLNAQQIDELAGMMNASQIEVVAFHHLPVFHTEHCVFCRFLSTGTDHTNCGHPCEKHKISLRDAAGRRHAVLADVGCRNTVFNAQPQVASKQLNGWRRSGIHHIRIEFVHQNRDDVIKVVSLFRQFLDGEIDPMGFESRMEKIVDQGITAGSLFVPKDFKQLVQLS